MSGNGIVGSRPGAGSGRALSPQFRARQWQPGQSGNPSGQSGLYGETVRLAREAAPDAIRRLIELMGSQDERVAAVACNAILDRAFGKPKDYEPEADDPEAQEREGEKAREEIMRRLDRLHAEHQRREGERNRALIDEMARSTANGPASEEELRERFARLMQERGMPL